jgi:hypothetical protein
LIESAPKRVQVGDLVAITGEIGSDARMGVVMSNSRKIAFIGEVVDVLTQSGKIELVPREMLSICGDEYLKI